MKVYSTKIIDKEFVQLLQRNGLELDQDNFIASENIAFEQAPSVSDLILFSSKRGVEALGKRVSQFKDQAIAVVGQQADLALKAYGVETKFVARDARDLIAWLDKQCYHSFTYYCSAQYLPDIPQYLEIKGAEFTLVPVYKTVKRRIEIKSVNYDLVMFFSPSGVSSFFEYNDLPKNSRALAIGRTTENALNNYVNKELIYRAQHPNMHSCIEKCIELVKNRTEI